MESDMRLIDSSTLRDFLIVLVEILPPASERPVTQGKQDGVDKPRSILNRL